MKNIFLNTEGIAVSVLFSFCIVSYIVQAQSLAINTTGSTAHASSILDVNSTNKGCWYQGLP